MGKHAFLIMAHKNDLSFRTLLQQLDDENSDIYIHMDIKNKNYDISEVENNIHKSTVYHIDRMDLTWGGYSLVACELNLLNEATNKMKYDYYHLLSGQDLLISTIDNVYNFFAKNSGKEFVRFESSTFKYEDRVRYYSIQEKVGRNKNLLYYVDRGFRLVQKTLKIKRSKSVEFQKGAQWFSITDDLARYVVMKENWVKKTFNYTFAPDEVFLQTLVYNSSFKERLYSKTYNNDIESIQRLIDWKRGTPYTFKSEDFDELVFSKMLFARKFDEKTDREIINKIFNYYTDLQGLG